jgi:hypothetical protein
MCQSALAGVWQPRPCDFRKFPVGTIVPDRLENPQRLLVMGVTASIGGLPCEKPLATVK